MEVVTQDNLVRLLPAEALTELLDHVTSQLPKPQTDEEVSQLIDASVKTHLEDMRLAIVEKLT